MKTRTLHDWQVTMDQAKAIQSKLATLVSTKSELGSPQLIAGVDISSPNARGIAAGAVVILSYPQLKVLEVKVAEQRIGFPYVPGLLSFREAPLILAAYQKLTMSPDLILVDGQGMAHPKRLGLASHLGLLLDVPTIGCAKSRLCGVHEPVGEASGSFTELRDGNEVIGAVLRTKNKVNPLYISIGHKIDLETAIFWVMQCCRGYRIPEPTRLAHLAAASRLESREGLQQREELSAKT
ncbi:deoxyribonuclease V [Chloroflexota bacterium]